MVKSGVVYGEGKTGEIRVGRRRWWLRMISRILRKSGKWLMAAAGAAAVVLLWPMISAEMKFMFGQTRVGRGAEKVANSQLELVVEDTAGEEREEEPQWKVPDREYSIYIPKILAKSRVIPEVDAGNRKEYLDALKQGVAEAEGLAHPGNVGTTYLFAHSVGTSADIARYNAVFYLLYKLETGDGIEIVYRGKLFKYAVEKKEVIAADDLGYLRPQKEEERLVLQTCYPPGTSWKRLVVVAKRTPEVLTGGERVVY